MKDDDDDIRRALQELADESGSGVDPESLNISRNSSTISITTDEDLRRKSADIVLTTTVHIEGHRVESYCGIESVEYVIGTGIFSELTSGVADMFGARSSAFENKLQQAKADAFSELQMRAVRAGANAVIGVDLDYTEFTGNRVALIVSGTLVKIVPKPPVKPRS